MLPFRQTKNSDHVSKKGNILVFMWRRSKEVEMERKGRLSFRLNFLTLKKDFKRAIAWTRGQSAGSIVPIALDLIITRSSENMRSPLTSVLITSAMERFLQFCIMCLSFFYPGMILKLKNYLHHCFTKEIILYIKVFSQLYHLQKIWPSLYTQLHHLIVGQRLLRSGEQHSMSLKLTPVQE